MGKSEMDTSCVDCGRALPDDRFPHCFGCRAKSISVSYPYGRKMFHESCLAERVRKENESCAYAAKAEGNVFEPKPVRSVLV